MSAISNVFVILEIKKLKMSNQEIYIPSSAIGEIEYDLEEKVWYAIQSTEFNENKVILFLKLIVDLRGVIIKYLKNQARLQRYTNYSLQTKIGLCLGLM